MRRPLCEYGHLVDGEVERCGREATHELPPPPGCYGREPLSLCQEAAREVGPAAETLRSPAWDDHQERLRFPAPLVPREYRVTVHPGAS